MPTSKLDIVVNSPPAAVWEAAGRFDSPATWHPFVSAVELSDNGQTRTLVLKNGQRSVEKLQQMDDKNRSYRYSLVKTGFPVEAFSATFTVLGSGNQSRIIWEADYGAVPGVSDEQAKAAVDRMFDSAGPGLKAKFG